MPSEDFIEHLDRRVQAGAGLHTSTFPSQLAGWACSRIFR
jgi:hypothetical protein